jgi:hypothetical protein
MRLCAKPRPPGPAAALRRDLRRDRAAVQSEGGVVTFMPFDGGHDAPPAVKDAFLDAVFGPLPGAPPHPLPASVERCMAPPHDQRGVGAGQPELVGAK